VTREITVSRTFEDFDDFWASVLVAASMAQFLKELDPRETEAFRVRVRARLPVGADGRITYASRANAVTGRVPV
jgi:hypothetical protein